MKIDSHTALIVVDAQNDFCPGGSLPVAEGDRVVPIINRYIELCKQAGAPIFATRDWHPADHCSFSGEGGSWPRHCVQDTPGARFHPDLALPEETIIISKATDPKQDAYSGFQGTDLSKHLKDRKIQKILIGGLATDYCVKSTVLDGLKAGFSVYFLSDASRAVNAQPRDGEKAIKDMISAGSHSLSIDRISI